MKSPDQPRGDDPGRIGIGEPLDQTQPQPHGKLPVPVGRLQRAVPAAGIGADRPDLDAMALRVAHDLGGQIKAHRLGVEQSGAEDVRMPAFHPGGGIGDQREGLAAWLSGKP